MAVTNLILSLEKHYGIVFENDELSAESFKTVVTLKKLLEKKINQDE